MPYIFFFYQRHDLDLTSHNGARNERGWGVGSGEWEGQRAGERKRERGYLGKVSRITTQHFAYIPLAITDIG